VSVVRLTFQEGGTGWGMMTMGVSGELDDNVIVVVVVVVVVVDDCDDLPRG
jgi:hypothetical protein